MFDDASRPALCLAFAEGAEALGRFHAPFVIGSDAGCDVVVEHQQVRPRHLEAVWAEGAWRLREVGRWNSTYVDGRTVRSVPVPTGGPEAEPLVVRLGWGGPALLFWTGDADGVDAAAAPAVKPEAEAAPLRSGRPTAAARPHTRPAAPGERPPSDEDAPLENASSPGAGAARGGVRKPWVMVVAVAVAAAVLLTLVGSVWVQVRTAHVEAEAEALFAELREHRLALSRLRQAVEAVGGADLDAQLDALAAEQAALGERYEGLIREFGLYRTLSEEERLIHRVARVFGESDVAMPAAFVAAVRREIESYWLGPGRARFERALERAEATGMTEHVVRTLQAEGLPPELFYVALQESDFEADAVGPPTRWGIAKGPWQFIPRTARRYGLAVGPREHLRVVDPLDERHDPSAATEAAARYLRFIYSTEAQSSGLLVIASYNWGEHRVAGRVAELTGPQAIPVGAFEGLPTSPEGRSYWDFLTVHRNRMPEETKDYVLKVFAAAVIGENPRLFGFDFDNPLAPYIERSGEVDGESG